MVGLEQQPFGALAGEQNLHEIKTFDIYYCSLLQLRGYSCVRQQIKAHTSKPNQYITHEITLRESNLKYVPCMGKISTPPPNKKPRILAK